MYERNLLLTLLNQIRDFSSTSNIAFPIAFTARGNGTTTTCMIKAFFREEVTVECAREDNDYFNTVFLRAKRDKGNSIG